MKRALVPFDGSDNALRAVAYAAEAAKEKPTLELELLYVMEPMPLRSNAAMTQDEMQKLYAAEAERVLRPARDALEKAGVAYQAHFRVGAATGGEIAAQARDKDCDAVIMGTRGMGPIPNIVIGSVATRVVNLVGVPVVLIK